MELGAASGYDVQVYQFDGSSLTLTNTQANYGSLVHSVDWFPNGKYLAAGGFVSSNNNELQVFSISYDSLPSKLKINNDTINLKKELKLENTIFLSS